MGIRSYLKEIRKVFFNSPKNREVDPFFTSQNCEIYEREGGEI